MYRITETFNKEFEEVARLKQTEISRIREKNLRVSKIIQQLQLTEQLVQPALQSGEHPEEILAVQVNTPIFLPPHAISSTHTHISSLCLPYYCCVG